MGCWKLIKTEPKLVLVLLWYFVQGWVVLHGYFVRRFKEW